MGPRSQPALQAAQGSGPTRAGPGRQAGHEEAQAAVGGWTERPAGPTPTPGSAAASLFSRGCRHQGPATRAWEVTMTVFEAEGFRFSSLRVCACVWPAACSLLVQGVSRSGFEGEK